MANFKVKNGLDIGNATYVGTISPSAITAARTYTLPNVSGTFVTTGDTGSITNTMILDGTIADAKLATITTAGKVANSATTAVSTNTANTIVTRDAGGGFSAGVISGVSFNSITALSSTSPLVNGTVSIGTSTTVARADHIHPIDTTRAPLASPVFTGNVTGLGVATGTSFNSITGLANIAPLMDGTAAVGTSTLAARQDHRHLSDTTKANISQMMYIGTTSVPINRGSGAITLAGTSIDGNAGSATVLSGDETNWATLRSRTVANMLSWKNYNNGHVIFDASASTAPNGASVNNADAANAWSPSYPTLMGWNGAQTYGVRVDSARVADRAYLLNPLSGDTNYKLAYTADGVVTNPGAWGRAVMRYEPNGQTYGIGVDRADYAYTSDTQVGTDNSNKIATTAFVQRHGNKYSGFRNITSSSNGLTSDVGGVVYASGTNSITYTLPPLGAGNLIPNGSKIKIWNSSSNPLIILPGSGDTLLNTNGSSASLKYLYKGEFIEFISTSYSWFAIENRRILGEKQTTKTIYNKSYGVTYTNNTDRSIIIYFRSGSGIGLVQLITEEVAVGFAGNAQDILASALMVVTPGSTYRIEVISGSPLGVWAELSA